jgi:alpha-mannosidase
MITINTRHTQLAHLWDYISSQNANGNFDRIHAELRFLSALSDSKGGKYDNLIARAAGELAASIKAEGTTTAGAVRKTEETLAGLVGEAKSYEFLCVSHAHIDMNWMWPFNETAAVTMDTFRTMLDLLEEYPDFVFSQSQASVYRIVEEYDPEMFAEIKKRVKEGRWEVTASTWVEADKNMPSLESQIRHILYTKKYFKEKFGVNRDDLLIDFEPDTFGHSANVPEILASGGVKYYYHFRGHVGDTLLNIWKAPSGAELMIYHDHFAYQGDISSARGEYAPELERLTGGKKFLWVYGVGDHGGGPTRRDLNRIMDMNKWPLFPKHSFAKLKDYFHVAETWRNTIKTIEGEINFVFDGCYTTQTRIKAGNLKAERLLDEAETYAGMAAIIAGRTYPASMLREAWTKVLFNQFHDILTGSGVTDTREYALGHYQQVFAAAETARKLALGSVAKHINTAPLFKKPGNPDETRNDTRAQGAGAGFFQTGRGTGKERVYHFFNHLPYPRSGVTPLVVWDYEGDYTQIVARDRDGKCLRLQWIEESDYCGHHYDLFLVEAAVPPCGWSSVMINEEPDYRQIAVISQDTVQRGTQYEIIDVFNPVKRPVFFQYQQLQKPDEFVLENENIRVMLNSLDGTIVSFIDKKTGEELSPPGGTGIFRLANECIKKGFTSWNTGMSSWTVGRYNSVESVHKKVEITPLSLGELRTAYRIQCGFGNGSVLSVVISLDAGDSFLRYGVICDWREFGSDQSGGVPNLHFHLVLPYKGRYRFDIPGGVIERKSQAMDMPAQSFVLAENPGGRISTAIISRDKYGFRVLENSIAVTLIRGSYGPDLSPEAFTHSIEFAVAIIPSSDAGNTALIHRSKIFRHPVTVISGKNQQGSLESEGSILEYVSGNISVSSFKGKEDENGKFILRLFETQGAMTKAVFRLNSSASSAYYTDATEEKKAGTITLEEGGKLISIDLPPYSVRSVVIET